MTVFDRLLVLAFVFGAFLPPVVFGLVVGGVL